MKDCNETVLGVRAPRPRPTWSGGLWLASIVTLPVAAVALALQALFWLV